MKALQFSFLILFCAALSACRNAQFKEPDKAGTENHLTYFKGAPPGIEGCSCFFSPTEEDFKEERFLLVANYEGEAFISVNDKPIRLKLKESTRDSDSFGDGNYRETYTDGVFTITIKVNFKEGTGDEAWWNTGKMTLYFKDTEMETREFAGECGC
jgi:negative regulator of sigma E activity